MLLFDIKGYIRGNSFPIGKMTKKKISFVFKLKNRDGNGPIPGVFFIPACSDLLGEVKDECSRC